ncbi:MAG: 2-oxoacid:ferredoxin oxidoreductase subunit beta, partial [Flavobacteriales bacterium]
RPTVIELTEGGNSINDVLVHDEKDSTLAFILANMTYAENLPRPMGVLQSLADRSSYEDRVVEQIQHEVEAKGIGNLESLLLGPSHWEI